MENEIHFINNSISNRRNITFRQFYIGSCASVFSLMYGVITGAPTVIIPQLRRQMNSTTAISDEMVSWISSIHNFSAMAWIVLLATSVFHIGCKKTSILVDILSCLAFINMYFSSSAQQVLISQALLGVTAATIITISFIIVTEYSHPRYRGTLITLKTASFFWGIWIANAIGTFFHWKIIALFGVACTIYNIVVTIIMPESPLWLAKKGRYHQCAKSHRWMKGTDEEMSNELETLINSQKKLRLIQNNTNSSCCNFRRYLNVILKPEIYKAMGCCFLVSFLYDASGKMPCTVYAIDMIKKVTVNETTAYMGMLVLDGFSVFAMYLAGILIKYVNRRTILFSANTICITLLYIMALYLLLIRFSVLTENRYIFLCMLVCYSVAACCGPIIMSTCICSEMVPIELREINMIVISVYVKMTSAVSVKIAPKIFNTISFEGTFFLYGTVSLCFMILAYKFVPETKDKTLNEIAQIFMLPEPQENRELMMANSKQSPDKE